MRTNLKKRPLFLFGVICAALFGIASPHGFALTVANGDFSDTNGLTAMTDGWYSGVPAGWTTTAPSTTGHEYSVRQIDGVSYANLDVLSQAGGATFSPLRRSLGTVGTTSDVTISFKAASLTPNAAFYVASGIFNAANDTALATLATPAWIDGSATLTYSAQGVPAGTELYVGFWTFGGASPGITDVTVSIDAAAKSISIQSGATLQLDPASPVSTDVDLVFVPGSKVKVLGTNAPTASAVSLLSTSGAISGSPSLDPAVEGYTLTNSGKVLWFRGPLALLNANFQDLGGLTDNGGGWYHGVPFGWSSSTGSLNFNVINWSSGNLGANLQTLGPSSPSFTPLYQSAGLLQSTGDVALSFNILGLNANPYGMSAAIYDASSGTGPGSGWTVLVSGSYDKNAPTTQTLTAENVAADTRIAVGFWQWAGSPGVDNVNLSITYANRAPADIALSESSIAENNLVGDVVGTLSAIDPDADDTHSFNLVSGVGDTDNASFEIDGSTLKAKVVFDYETQASYSIRVRSTDAGSLFTEQTFTITVTDVSEQTPQQAYLASFGLSGGDLLGTADPDGDGMDNDAEFAFGTNPVSGASRAVTLTSGTGEIILTYLQRNSGVTYTVKSLPSLTTDFDSGTDVGPVASDPQPSGIPGDYTQYEASISTGSARGFLRVRAVAD